MGLKKMVMELFRAGDVDGLNGLLSREPRAMRHLVGRLWDNDEQVRDLAAKGLGHAAAVHPDQARDLVRRLIWALNDESAMNGVYGLAALGEIGAQAPELMMKFVAPMASYLWDQGLRTEILRALLRMAHTNRGLIEEVHPILESFYQDFDENDRRLAAEILRGIDEN